MINQHGSKELKIRNNPLFETKKFQKEKGSQCNID